LRNVQGYSWKHKRVCRTSCELALIARLKPKTRLKLDKPQPLVVPARPNKTFSIDFMADQLAAERVVRSLNRIIEQREKPQSVRIENGPEYVRGTLME
jgi:putative transposase